MNEQKVTIRDVARQAGVSPTTVSRYMNNHLSLPAATVERIEDAVKKLNYHPNSLARKLSLGQSKTIGLITPDIANPYFASLASAIEDEATRHGYSVLLCSTQNQLAKELSYLQQLRAKQFDGVLLMTAHGHEKCIADLVDRYAHVVVIDEDVEHSRVAKVLIDNAGGGREATQHLVQLGHRRIAFIGGPEHQLSVKERFLGYLNVLQAHHIEIETQLIHFGPYIKEFGAEATRRLLTLRPRPTAIFAANDYLALGALKALKDHGVRIPREMSLIGFDDIPHADLLDPPLTTIRQPIDDLGRIAVKVLLGGLEGTGAIPPSSQRLPVALIQRASTTTCPAEPTSADGEAEGDDT